MIVVTGATGNIGSEVVKLLAQQGAAVRALVRTPAKAAGLKAPGVEIAQGDLADHGSLEGQFRGAERLFLLTNAGPDQVALQHNAIEAAKKAGVRHIVKLSAVGAQRGARIKLGDWHGQTEAELKASGVAFTILQPSSFMQNLLNSAASIKGQSAFYGTSGEGKFPHIDTRDIAAVAVAALTGKGHEGKTYVLTGPEALSQGQLAEKLSAALGRPIKYVNLPAEQFNKALLSVGLPDWLASDLTAMQTFFATGGAARTTSTVKDVTGHPGRTFDDFAKDFAPAFR